MLHVRVHGPALAMQTDAKRLASVEDAAHIARADAGDGSGRALVTADLRPGAVDAVLERIDDLGVPATEASLRRLEEIQHGPLRRETLVVWADLLGTAGRNARPVARYPVFMAVAGVIAAYGVIYENASSSSARWPSARTCCRSLRPAWRSRCGVPGSPGAPLWTLAAGLGAAGLAAALLTALLDLLDLLPSVSLAGEHLLSGLTTVNDSTLIIAFVAGIAAMLAQETRASSAVGVAISVTTIPASAYLGVAAAVGEIGEAWGALLVLGVNVVALVAGGTATLFVQRALERRSA